MSEYDPDLDLPKYSDRDLQELADWIRHRTQRFLQALAVSDARDRVKKQPEE
jgi:hypothetical protein